MKKLQKNIVKRDKSKRVNVKNFELKRKFAKSFSRNVEVKFEKKYQEQILLSLFSKNTAKERVRNRCVLSGKSRGILNKTKLSRIKFRDNVSQGHIIGFQKSS